MEEPTARLQRTTPADLRQHLQNVRAFLFAANAQSIAKAADQLFKTPSAVTRSVLELEKFVGAPLFERTSRGILLNTYGNTVLTRANRINAELNQAAAELARLKSKSSPSAINHLLFSGRKLELLIHLVDSGKISAAAAQMNVTQSGASMALARIEAVLGEPLFWRGKHGMIATDAAERLVTRAKRVIAEFRHMVSDISALSGTLKGSVVIGTLPLGRTYIFPMAIAETLARHPQINVTIVESPFEQLIAGLRSGDIDAIVGVPRDDAQNQDLTIEPLFTDRLAIMARAGHPLASRGQVPLEALTTERWILPWSNSPSRTLFEACFQRKQLQPPSPSVESADLAVIRQLLIASDMLAVASARQVMFELKSGLFTELPVVLTEMTREVGLIVRDGAVLSPAALALLEAIRSQVAHDAAETETNSGVAPRRHNKI